MKLYNLIENTSEISENSALKRFMSRTLQSISSNNIAGLRNVDAKLADDLLNISKSRQIKGVNNADELVNALKSQTLNKQGMGDLMTGALKTKDISDDFVRAVVPMWVEDPRFLTAWTQPSKKLSKNGLLGKGYSSKAADEIISYSKRSKKFQDAIKSGGYKPNTKIKPSSSGRKKVPSGWVKYKDEVLKKLKLGWKWYQLLKWGAGLGISGAILWYIVDTFGGDDKPSDMPTTSPSEWSTCVDNMISAGMGQGSTLDDGTEVVTIKDSTYPNGIVLYSNGTLKDLTNNKTGRWVCKEGDAEPIQESKKMFSLLDIILEQEFDEELTNDVDRIRRYLNFPVTQSGLRSAYQILKKYYDNGKGEDFLRRYKRSGWGRGDMEKTLKYIVTTNETSIEIKDQLINLVKRIRSGENQNQGSQTGDNNQRRRLDDYINITWDGEQVQTGSGTSTAPNVRYFDCENWDINTKPYIIGCQSSKIREIQSCLGENPDGKFGPNTQKALMDIEADMSKGITAEIYNRVMRNCNRPELETNQQTQQEPETTQQEPETTQQEPETTQSTDGELQTGVEPIQFGEISFSSPQETGEQFYMRLLNNNRFIGSSDKNRIKYKDYPLTKDEYNKLTEFLSTKGFYPLKAKEKGDEKMKYVWKKSSRQ